MYSKCYLNIKLWYRNSYGDYELNGETSVEVIHAFFTPEYYLIVVLTPLLCLCLLSSDGKLYDAYISYVNNDHDRKFVNFILKPHLENKNTYKLHLNDNDILPGCGKFSEIKLF